jgi:hypothetical protein
MRPWVFLCNINSNWSTYGGESGSNPGKPCALACFGVGGRVPASAGKGVAVLLPGDELQPLQVNRAHFRQLSENIHNKLQSRKHGGHTAGGGPAAAALLLPPASPTLC